ncbi:MAG: mechanosensitive ion channel family protein [Candidatus Aenigmarchaeota archaeon]|nr:mechanosensitive ion channel family protein [Candidatus Aenigmarchaeota archaeon]
MELEFFLNQQFAGNIAQDYIAATAVFFISFILLKVFKALVLLKLKVIVKSTKTQFDDLIVSMADKIGLPLYLFISLYLATHFVKIPDIIRMLMFSGITIIGTYYTIVILNGIIEYGAQKISAKRMQEGDSDTEMIEILSKIFNISLWILGFFFVLINLGFNITPLIAGLGIGGVAVAFALQNVLDDVFASFSIFFDRPFKKGDFIIVGNDMGVVKNIGIKSTRMQTLQGQELIISNKELTEARVNNYKRMEKRRVVFNFGIKYETPVEKIQQIPVMIFDIIRKINDAEIDRAHFQKFGDFSLVFEVVYYIKSANYNIYMDIQQEINIGIMQKFKEECIEFAYPTQVVHLTKERVKK